MANRGTPCSNETLVKSVEEGLCVMILIVTQCSRIYSETFLEDHPYSNTTSLNDHICVAWIAF
jgi:hypothetical protein